MPVPCICVCICVTISHALWVEKKLRNQLQKKGNALSLLLSSLNQRLYSRGDFLFGIFISYLDNFLFYNSLTLIISISRSASFSLKVPHEVAATPFLLLSSSNKHQCQRDQCIPHFYLRQKLFTLKCASLDSPQVSTQPSTSVTPVIQDHFFSINAAQDLGTSLYHEIQRSVPSSYGLHFWIYRYKFWMK